MHMADALITPTVGMTLWAASAALGGWSLKRLREHPEEERVPMMGVMGAFVFSAQMVNFAIPGTGSSGHLGGGLLLAAVLGPHAAFLTIGTVLALQALLFADGGLLAYGCNLFNLGFFPCYIAWPLIMKPLLGESASRKRITLGAMLGAVAALQMGAFSVVLETLASGRTELPFTAFLLLMQPIHLAIGLVEGLVTAAVVQFLLQARPETLSGMMSDPKGLGLRRSAAVSMLVLALVTGTVFSGFASSDPDGLEWSLFRVTGQEELEADGPTYEAASALQRVTALLPDYSLPSAPESGFGSIGGTAFSGLVGSLGTLGLLALGSYFLKPGRRNPGAAE